MTVASVEAPIVWIEQSRTRIPGAVADSEIADAVRPGVIGADRQAAAQTLGQREHQAVVTRRPAIVVYVHIADQPGTRHPERIEQPPLVLVGGRVAGVQRRPSRT